MTTTQTKPSIVFCHGIWADGSCFNNLIPTLQAEGHQVIAVQYGLDSQAADVAATKRTLGRVSSPAILVGHSYGGGVITRSGEGRVGEEGRSRGGPHHLKKKKKSSRRWRIQSQGAVCSCGSM